MDKNNSPASRAARALAKRRKKPYSAFKDPAFASEASKKGWTPERRRLQSEAQTRRWEAYRELRDDAKAEAKATPKTGQEG